jgi:hypothetical protein
LSKSLIPAPPAPWILRAVLQKLGTEDGAAAGYPELVLQDDGVAIGLPL